VSLSKVLDVLAEHEARQEWHRGSARGDWHQRQIDRINERLAKCCVRIAETDTREPFHALVERVTVLRKAGAVGGVWDDSVLLSRLTVPLTPAQRRAAHNADDDGRTLYEMTRGET
jgi:hypothetical protein